MHSEDECSLDSSFGQFGNSPTDRRRPGDELSKKSVHARAALFGETAEVAAEYGSGAEDSERRGEKQYDGAGLQGGDENDVSIYQRKDDEEFSLPPSDTSSENEESSEVDRRANSVSSDAKTEEIEKDEEEFWKEDEENGLNDESSDGTAESGKDGDESWKSMFMKKSENGLRDKSIDESRGGTEEMGKEEKSIEEIEERKDSKDSKEDASVEKDKETEGFPKEGIDTRQDGTPAVPRLDEAALPPTEAAEGADRDAAAVAADQAAPVCAAAAGEAVEQEPEQISPVRRSGRERRPSVRLLPPSSPITKSDGGKSTKKDEKMDTKAEDEDGPLAAGDAAPRDPAAAAADEADPEDDAAAGDAREKEPEQISPVRRSGRERRRSVLLPPVAAKEDGEKANPKAAPPPAADAASAAEESAPDGAPATADNAVDREEERPLKSCLLQRRSLEKKNVKWSAELEATQIIENSDQLAELDQEATKEERAARRNALAAKRVKVEEDDARKEKQGDRKAKNVKREERTVKEEVKVEEEEFKTVENTDTLDEQDSEATKEERAARRSLLATKRVKKEKDADVKVKKETKVKEEEPKGESESSATAAPKAPPTALTKGRKRGRPSRLSDVAPVPDGGSSTASTTAKPLFKSSRRQSITYAKGITPKTIPVTKEEKAAAKWRRGLPDEVNAKSDFQRQEVYNIVYEHLKKMLTLAEFSYHPTDAAARKLPSCDVSDEVYSREHEGVSVWDQQTRELEKRNEGRYDVDYIVNCEGRPFLSGMTYPTVLVKYSGYPVPSWNEYDLNGLSNYHVWEWERRVAVLDLVELQLRKRLGNELFEKTFGKRWISNPTFSPNGAYATDEHSLYVNRLRAIESKWNVVTAQKGEPLIYVEDWTGLPPADKELRELEFILGLHPDADVQKLLDEHVLATNVKCGASCTSCVHNETTKVRRECCGLQSSLHYDKFGHVTMCKKSKKLSDEEKSWRPSTNLYYECTPECHRKEETSCKSRRITNGRPQAVIVFRHPVKGWCLHVSAELEQFQFLTSYAGEVKLEASAARTPEKIYDFCMPNALRVKTTGKEIKPFTVHAYKKGNEARFLAHNCEGNLAVRNIVYERYGAYYVHLAFLADRDISAGEEVHFDYFVSSPDNDVSEFFPECGCRSKTCRYSAERVRDLAEETRRDLEEASGDEEEEGDGQDGQVEENEQQRGLVADHGAARALDGDVAIDENDYNMLPANQRGKQSGADEENGELKTASIGSRTDGEPPAKRSRREDCIEGCEGGEEEDE